MGEEFSIFGDFEKNNENDLDKIVLKNLEFKIENQKIILIDKSKAKNIETSDLDFICKEFSVLLKSEVRFQKISEVYGVSNVFNGGSDYGVVSECRYCVVFKNGEKIKSEFIKL